MAIEDIDLDICFPFEVVEPELTQWKNAFNRTSEIIFHATDEQMKLGVLNVFIDADTTNDTDILIDEEEHGQSSQGNTGIIQLFREVRNYPTVIVHEFGHYEFGLGEEYPIYRYILGDWIQSHGGCTDTPNDHSCIMQYAENLVVTEFCHSGAGQPGEHQPGNQQHQVNGGKSCWDSIVTKYSAFEVPTPKREIGTNPDLANHDEIGWIVASGGSGYVVVLESSSRFAGAGFVEGQANGVGFWIDLVSVEKHSFGIVNSSGDALFNLKKLENESDTNQAHAVIEQIAFTGEKTDVVATLDQISTQFAEANPFQTKSATWISADEIVAAPNPNDSISFRQNGIRANSIGIGVRDPFFALSDKTRGEIRHVVGKDDGKERSFRIQNALIESCLESQRGYQLIASAISRFPESIVDSEHPAPKTPPVKDEELLDKILVEPGTAAVIFAISQSESAPIDLEIINPDGNKLNPDVMGNAVFVKKPFYQFVKIVDPAPGVWALHVTADSGEDARFIKSYCYSLHRNLFVKLRSWRAGPRQVDLFGSAFLDGLLADLEPVAVSIYAPGWLETAPDPSLVQEIYLKPVQFYNRDIETIVTPNKEVLRGTFTVDKAGVYTVVARFINAGRGAIHTSLESRCQPIPPFVRTIVRQIRVMDN